MTAGGGMSCPAVTRVCFCVCCLQTYGMGGENLRGLTEKLRVVAHSLPIAIQGGWRHNSYDGRSATKLPAGVLKNVIELITSARGLFCLLNRYQLSQLSRYTSTQSIFTHCRNLGDIVHKVGCRQLVEVCDEILNSSSDSLLTHTAQLESVNLVPATLGDQLGIEIASTSSSNHYVTGTPSTDAYLRVLSGDEVIQVNDQIVVGWSRARLIEKVRENPGGVTLIIKRIPGSLQRKHSIQITPVQVSQVSFTPSSRSGSNLICLSYFSSKAVQFALHHKNTNKKARMSTALSRRRVSCRDLAHPDCDGWLWKKRKESSVFITQKWQRFWFVLKGPNLYWYNTQQDEKAEGLLSVSSYNLESGGEHKRKHVFQMTHKKFQNFFFAVDSAADLNGGTVDEMGRMFNNLKEGGVSLIGHEQPFTQDHFRKSFIRRNKNPVINEKVHTLRALHSTLKAKEAELLQINKLLDESDLTASKYRRWKDQNEELVSEIEKLASAAGGRDVTPAGGSRGGRDGRDVAPAEGGEDVAPAEGGRDGRDIAPAEGSENVAPAEGGEDVALAEGGEDVASTEGSEDVASVWDTPAEDVALETVATETAAAETEAYRLSLSDGEQLVDAEPSDVRLEIPRESPSPESSPLLELSLGSLSDSINNQLRKNGGHYFYI
uniref:Connector enhancer of kinase suppressor of Ras 1 n=1 Tax=Xiphophorus couchianus TaxID=32473 RepID=A0A3B5L6B0_9TELE